MKFWPWGQNVMSQGSEQQSGWGHQCVPGCGFSVTSTVQRSASHGNTCAGCLSWGIHLFLNIIYMNWSHGGRRRSYFYCDVSSCKHLAAIVNICGSAICIVFRLFVVTSCQVDFFAVASRNMKISSKNQWLDYISIYLINLTTCISNYHHLLSDFWNKEMHIVSTVSWWRVVKTFYLFQI